jgi:hypothetical protein
MAWPTCVVYSAAPSMSLQRGQFNLAARMLDGGFLTVVSAQGRYSFDADTTDLPPDAVNHDPAASPPHRP